MSWYDQLQQASFRGVEFQADTSLDWIGRDKIVRSYPFRDKPTLQDVGGVSEPGQFSAYVFGEDAFDKRDALMRALNKPGPGDLIHPWFGLMRVEIIGKVAVRHSTLEGGVVRMDINFLMADVAVYPKATENTARTTQAAIDTARANLVNDFSSKFSFDNLAGWAADHGLSTVTGALDAVNGTVNKLLTKPEGFLLFETKFRLFTQSINDAIGAPDTLALGILSTMDGLSNLGDNFTDALHRHETLFNWRSNYTPSPYSTPTRKQEQQNNDAVENLVQAGALLVAAETIANVDFTTDWNYAEAMAWRAKMNAQFQAVLGNMDGDAYQSMLDAMTALLNDMVTRSRHLGRVSTITTRDHYMAAMLVSYEEYGVIDYEDEIVMNNHIAHPLFIEPRTTLELISHD